MGKKIAVFYPDTEGLTHDARVLKTELKRIAGNISLVTGVVSGTQHASVIELPALDDLNSIDTLFCLERITIPEKLRSVRRKILVPNPEWFGRSELSRVEWIDEVWHKTEKSLAVLKPLFPARVKHHLVFWSSEDTKMDIAQDFTRFIHIRGASHQKQTEVVLDTWLANPEYPPLLILNYVNDHRFLNIPFTIQHKNVSIISRKLARDELLNLANSHGVHLCPSIYEGFGHYINEAKSIGALVITTDAEPMNQLITKEIGCLIPVHSMQKAGLVDKNLISRKDLENIIEYVLSLTKRQRQELGQKARISYLEQTQQFQSTLAKAFFAG